MERLLAKLPVDLFIAARYILANLRQSLIIMLAVGIGVSIIIFIPSVNLSFFNYFLQKTVESSPHITVTRELDTMPRNQEALQTLVPRLLPQAGRILYSDQTQTRRRNILAYKRLMDQLERMPGVVAVAPYVKEQVIAVRGNQSRAADLNGILPDREILITSLADDVMEGDILAMGTNEVFIGYLLADELGVGIGDRIKLVSAFGERSYKVGGLIKTDIYLRDYSIIYQPLQQAQKLLDMNNEVTGLGLKIKDIYDAETMARLIAETYNVKTRSWMEDNKVYLDQISNFRVIISVISILIIFAAATSITSVLIMVVASKSKEIGILKAMGTRPRAILRLFVSQAILLSILGAIGGFFGALFLIWIYNLSPAGHGTTVLGIEREPTTLNVEFTIYAFIYSIGASVLASIIPAWMASRLDPVEAINQ